MSSVAEIHQGKEPIRRHYIKEWAELRGMRPVDLATELGVEISQVTRWFAGQMPRPDTQLRLAQLFGGEDADPNMIQRHPDDDWLAKFFTDRSDAERARIREAMELLFPRQNTNRSQ
jgi:transcriptional regulator with XRE-family HTH domain